MRVPTLNQRHLLRSPPSLELLLPRECLVHVIVGLKIEQPDHLIAICEARELMKFMLKDSTVKGAADSDVQGARQTSHNVHTVILAITGHDVEGYPPTIRCGSDERHTARWIAAKEVPNRAASSRGPVPSAGRDASTANGLRCARSSFFAQHHNTEKPNDQSC
jgi:hypothetical protein